MQEKIEGKVCDWTNVLSVSLKIRLIILLYYFCLTRSFLQPPEDVSTVESTKK